MKKNFLVILAFFIIVFCFYGISKIVEENEISVEDLNVIIQIDENGDMNVSETWLVNWPEGMKVSFRDIGYGKYVEGNPLPQSRTNTASFNTDVNVQVFDKNLKRLDQDKYRVGYSFRGDKDELGNRVECYPARYECESIFIHVFSGMQSQMTFKYNYKIEGAVTKYQDVAELNWRLLDYFEGGVKNAKVEILIPKADSELLAWGHGLSFGNIVVEDKKVILNIDKLRNGEFLEFRTIFDKDLVNVDDRNYIDAAMKSDIINYEEELARETNNKIFIAKIIFYGAIAIILIMIYILYYLYKKYDKEHVSSFTGQYYRELPKDYSPAEMSYLYHFKQINNEDLTATLLDLIRRKYLVLDTAGESVSKANPNFKIVLNKDVYRKQQKDLLAHEKHLIEWFINEIGNKEEVTLHQVENYPKDNYQNAKRFENNAKEFVRKAANAGKKHDFFEDVDKSKAMSFVFIPLIYLFIALFTQSGLGIDNSFAVVISIALSVVLILYISTIKKRSVNGNEDYVRWKAFKNFLEDFGRMEDYPMPGIVVWEHYLVYATSLKVADKVMEQLTVKLPRIEGAEDFNKSTYIGFGYRYYGFHFGYTLSRINNTVTTARSNSSRTIQAHNASRVGGGGRGGGFGGGSSFGGGGGGFRGR